MSYSPAGKEILTEQIRETFVRRGYDGATLAHLARATGLSRASLYHHFPAGKPEMASTLTRHAIIELQTRAFNHLNTPEPLLNRLIALINGFAQYTAQGSRPCLLAVFIHHDTASEETAELQLAITQQFRDWHTALTQAFMEGNLKEKKAHQQAHELVTLLYGSLIAARMHDQSELFAQAMKRLKKQLKQRFGH